MNIPEFLTTIFSDAISPEHQLSIFSLPSRAIKRFASVDNIETYVAQQATTQNVYYGLALIKGNPPGRGTLEDVAGIGCLWADIDIASPGHTKSNLPPTIEAAQAILDALPLKPSLIINSGGGLHPYWLFKEVWLFGSPAERAAAATLSRRLAGTLRNIAAEHGYDLDNVGALTQILRLPDTLNYKYDPPIEVEVIESNDLRYVPDDFEDILLDDKLCQVSQVVEIGDIVLRAGAEPPAMKLTALLENDPKFKKSWRRARPDLQDQSASAYCCSLASIAAAAGWSDQEIADLIIAWRELHNDKPAKALRWDWVRATIARGRTGQQQDSIEKLAEVIGEIKDTPGKRSVALREISRILGIKIARWIQHGREHAQYALELASGETVRMGTTAQILNARTFKTRLFEGTNYLIEPIKAKQWDSIIRCLAEIGEVIENQETTSAYQAQQWVDSYLMDYIPQEDGWQEAAYFHKPFINKGLLHIHTSGLRTDMRVSQGENSITPAELCECLRLAGFTRRSVTAWHDGKSRGRSYWTSPLPDNPPLLRKKKEGEANSKVPTLSY